MFADSALGRFLVAVFGPAVEKEGWCKRDAVGLYEADQELKK
jgi:hypothetical protein